MITATLALVATLHFLSVFATVSIIGKERKPVTPGTAMYMILINLTLLTLCLLSLKAHLG